MTPATVLVTASAGAFPGLVEALRAIPVAVEDVPLMTFAPPLDWGPVDAAVRHLDRYAAIALTRDAAEAANRNYELVSDAYSRGAADITTLIDAQSAAEQSSESAANAVHDFLLDLFRVERAMGDFGTLRSPEDRQAFLERLRALKEKP